MCPQCHIGIGEFLQISSKERVFSLPPNEVPNPSSSVIARLLPDTETFSFTYLSVPSASSVQAIKLQCNEHLPMDLKVLYCKHTPTPEAQQATSHTCDILYSTSDSIFFPASLMPPYLITFTSLCF